MKHRTLLWTLLALVVLVGGWSRLGMANPMGESLPAPEQIKHLPPDGGDEFNRLIFEQSPYLLQHARNPVDWWPWGEAAFAAAKEQNKPVFLSIGYSTCHWCHVMEHESFEDKQIAAMLNDVFIPVKVDREERPDIDQLYMTVTQAMTGQGGWPMTVFLTPEKKPFFAGTYFPKTSRHGMPGVVDLVHRVGQVWKEDPAGVLESADKITTQLQGHSSVIPGVDLDTNTLDQAFREFESNFDEIYGGMQSQRKFPVPHNYRFLLRYAKRTGNKEALHIVEKTLTAMRQGGIFDHVGLGFHRYSTDEEWLLPHFEKMLYDNALIAMTCIEAYQFTGKPIYRQIAEEIFTYVLRDMTSPEGGFYTAEDADSEGEEGLFYVWEPQEVTAILGEEDGQFFNEIYNIVEGGNFREESTGIATGKNIPHLQASVEYLAEKRGMTAKDLETKLEGLRQKLFEEREKRIHPLKDDKILTDWNGLMIAALAMAGRTFDDHRYTAAAAKAAHFVLEHLRDERGRLLKRYRQGQAAFDGVLDDYAFFCYGLIELHQTTQHLPYLEDAITLTDAMLEHFWDDEHGGFFLTANDGERLLVRSREFYDGAIPAGNNVAALNLLRLGRLTGSTHYEEKAQATLAAASGVVARMPSQYSQYLIALDFALGPAHEVVVSGRPETDDTTAMLRALHEPFLPNKVVLLRTEENAEDLAKIAAYTKSQLPENGKATAYVCQNFSCQAPTNSVEAMEQALAR